MKRVFKIGLSAAVVLAIAGVFIWLSGNRKDELADMPTPEAPVHSVYVDIAEAGKLSITRQYLGTVEPIRHAAVAFRVEGHLVWAEKEAGDSVSQGEVVAKIDERRPASRKTEIEAELAGARTEMARIKEQVERRRPLLEKGLIDPEAMETVESAYTVAQARVDSLKARLATAGIDMAYTAASAPFDGVITTRHKQKGDLAMPGEPVYTVEKPDAGYAVIVAIPRETALIAVPGGNATIMFNSREIETTLHRIYPSTQTGRLARAEIRLDRRPFDLPSGSFVTVDLHLREAAGILVSAATILVDEANARVFRIDDHNRVEIIEVTVLGRKGADAVITGPVSPGDRLVAAEESMLLQLSEQSPIMPRERPMDGIRSKESSR